jgi:single-stranded-DNA-specific exonuclease
MELTLRDSTGWEGLPENWPMCIRKAIAARGVRSEHELVYSLADLPRPHLLKGMSEAVALLEQALKQQWRVMIVADFDSDGATSCAVAIRGLKAMGLNSIEYIVPNRFIHGYGLTPALLKDIPRHNQPDLLITVDNGIASIDGVDVAHQRGMKVIVTDHHLPAETLPKADAIINPNQLGDSFPSKQMAGVGVCFYMLLGLRQHLRQTDWFKLQKLAEPKLIDLLDLVALGTVADVVVLDKLNRSLVNIGLNRIRRGLVCVGIRALIEVAARQINQLSTSDIGFAIAPRINAAGRMEDMGIGINTLLTDNYDEALMAARELDNINLERRVVEKEMQDHALTMLDNIALKSEKPLAYCLYDEQWHQGVVGLLASRIKERQYRPVFAFAPGDDGEIKGSARSIPGIHIRDVLALVANKHPDMLSKFGGHAMAAGLTIKREHLNRFRQSLLTELEHYTNPEVLKQTTLSDGEVRHEDMTLVLAESIPLVAPWGQGFSEPLFHGQFNVESIRPVGQDSDHLRLTLRLDNHQTITAMAFRQYQPDWLEQGNDAVLVYRLSVNTFRQTKTVQMIVETILPLEQGDS